MSKRHQAKYHVDWAKPPEPDFWQLASFLEVATRTENSARTHCLANAQP